MPNMNGSPIESQLKHIQLKKSLHDAIMNGEFKPGDRIPSQDRIAEEYRVSLSTVREAITSLVHEGLLLRIQGKGTFVAEFKKKPIELAFIIPRLYGEDLPGMGAGTEVTLLLTQAIESAARKAGAIMLLYMYHDDLNIEAENLRNVGDLQVDGLIMIHMGGTDNLDRIKEIRQSGTQVVFIDTHIPGTDFDYVTSNNAKGAEMAVQALVDNGYRRIIHITREKHVSSLDERLTGYNMAMQKAALNPEIVSIPGDIVQSSQVEQASRALTKDLLCRSELPLAIFTADAPLMAGVLHALESMHVEPGSIGLACYDDPNVRIPNGILFIDVVQELHEIGTKGVEIIMRRLAGDIGDLSTMIDPSIRITDKRC
jgi:GntR family transcriptional regulator of arabinose operon